MREYNSESWVWVRQEWVIALDWGGNLINIEVHYCSWQQQQARYSKNHIYFVYIFGTLETKWEENVYQLLALFLTLRLFFSWSTTVGFGGDFALLPKLSWDCLASFSNLLPQVMHAVRAYVSLENQLGTSLKGPHTSLCHLHVWRCLSVVWLCFLFLTAICKTIDTFWIFNLSTFVWYK